MARNLSKFTSVFRHESTLLSRMGKYLIREIFSFLYNLIFFRKFNFLFTKIFCSVEKNLVTLL